MATSAYIFTSKRAAAEMAAAAASSGLEANSVAVLYFDDLSSGGELAYVADGITEALIEQLSQVRSLDVISRNGVAQFRATDVTVDSIASALEVGSVIRGSVEQAGERLRVTTRLVDGFSGADIERTTLEIPAGEFLAARDSVAESVSRLLRQRLGEEVELRQRQAGTENVEAWSLVQRAERLRKQAENEFEEGSLESAIASSRQADSLLAVAERADEGWVEPLSARAHGAFRRAYFYANAGDLEAAGMEIDAGLGHAERAVALSPNDADASEQRGRLKYLRYLLGLEPDPDDAERLLRDAQADLEAATERDPTLASAYSVLSHLHANRDDLIALVLTARRALEEDTYLGDAHRLYHRLATAHYDLGQFRDSKVWCEEGGRRFPENYRFAECQLWLMAVPSEDATVDSAWAMSARLDSLAPETMRPFKQRVGRLAVAGVLGKTGMPDSAESVYAQAKGDDEIDPLQELMLYEAAIRATTGGPDGAIEVLGRYLAASPDASIDGEHWWWSSLLGRPDFETFVRQTN
jgi:TolB-like protein